MSGEMAAATICKAVASPDTITLNVYVSWLEGDMLQRGQEVEGTRRRQSSKTGWRQRASCARVGWTKPHSIRRRSREARGIVLLEYLSQETEDLDTLLLKLRVRVNVPGSPESAENKFLVT